MLTSASRNMTTSYSKGNFCCYCENVQLDDALLMSLDITSPLPVYTIHLHAGPPPLHLMNVRPSCLKNVAQHTGHLKRLVDPNDFHTFTHTFTVSYKYGIASGVSYNYVHKNATSCRHGKPSPMHYVLLVDSTVLPSENKITKRANLLEEKCALT